MGQFFVIANLTKKMGFSPTSTGNNEKLGEFGRDGFGAMGALSLLLHGTWGGERIAVVGDYSQAVDLSVDARSELGDDADYVYDRIVDSKGTSWRNVGWLARKVLKTSNVAVVEKSHDEYVYTPLPTQDREPANLAFINLDKGQFITATGFGDTPTLHGVAARGGRGGTLSALAFLLATDGGGHPTLGSWAGDRIDLTLDPFAGSGLDNLDARCRHLLATRRWCHYASFAGQVCRDEDEEKLHRQQLPV